jgi:hypothetical protein
MSKLDEILQKFDADIAEVSDSSELTKTMLAKIQRFNPYFVPIQTLEEFVSVPAQDPNLWHMLSQLDEQEKQILLAKVNIYKGIYSPLIHAFTAFVLKLMQENKIPNSFVIPPRDPIPIYFAMLAQANINHQILNIVTPAMNRHIAGIPNNQIDEITITDKYFADYVRQELAKLGHPNCIVEIEPGIYSTTSLMIAEYMNNNGHLVRYMPLKLYGKGPNFSFIHGLLTGGKQYVAETAEQDPAVADLADACMVILDTIEEFGAQNATKSPQRLLEKNGVIYPDYELNDAFAQCLASLTNAVIIMDAERYKHLDDIGQLKVIAQNLIFNVHELIDLAHEGIPLVFNEPIPSMDDKEAHYAALREAQTKRIINYNILES